MARPKPAIPYKRPKAKRKPGPNRKMGPPTKLTDRLQRKICDLIRKGNFIDVACSVCGICRNTLTNWNKWGSAYIAAGKDKDGNDLGIPKHRIYARFVRGVKLAIDEAEVIDVAILDEMAKTDIRALKLKLISRNDRWNVEGTKKHEHVHEGSKNGVPIQHEVNAKIETEMDVNEVVEAMPFEHRKVFYETLIAKKKAKEEQQRMIANQPSQMTIEASAAVVSEEIVDQGSDDDDQETED